MYSLNLLANRRGWEAIFELLVFVEWIFEGYPLAIDCFVGVLGFFVGL